MAILGMAGLAGGALAQQAIERNLPAAVEPPRDDLITPPAVNAKRNDTPFGVDLKGIRLLGAKDEPDEKPPIGLSFGKVDDVPDETVREALQPFLGKALSQSLIADVQAAVVSAYRKAGFPFVSVTVPPQEITSGVLHLRVVEFRLGDVKVLGGGKPDPSLPGNVRIGKGDRIDEEQLSEDLRWLNRSPYRRVQGEFAPGVEDATSILGLRVTSKKPWDVNAGWSNTGTPISGRDRMFVGAGVWLPWLHDVTLSYQLTANEDVLRKPERVQLDRGDRPRYLSHAGRVIIPTLPRQALEISPSFVAMHQEPDDFISFDNTIFELPIMYRSAVSNLLSGVYFGDIYAGAEFKALHRTTYFTDIEVAQGKAELVNLVFGWSHELKDRYGRTSFDMKFKLNPGGVLDKNDDATWRLYTGGRVDDIHYGYAALDIMRITTLPKGFSWVSQISALVADQTLPDTERISLGGISAVRGYSLDEGTVDTGFIWRNELRLPPQQLAMRIHPKLGDVFSPYVFSDFAYGRDLGLGQSRVLVSTGAGFDYNLADHISTSMSLGYVLRNAERSRTGDWNLQAKVSLTF